MFDPSSMTTVDTRAVHAGRDDLAALGVHVPPIDFSTTNPLPSVDAGGDAYEALATGGTLPAGGSAVYQRLWNPTVARFETALADLEDTTDAVAFASGMAALTATLLAATRDGRRHLVAVRPSTAAPTTCSPPACSAPPSPGPAPTRSPPPSAPTPPW